MKLYTYWRSSCSWRVRIALAYKGLAYDSVPVHLVHEGGQQNKSEFLQLNPLGQLPVLELTYGGQPMALTQSMAILEFLEELYPTPALLPHDPALRAKARSMAEMVNSGIQPLQNLAVLRRVETLGADKDQWAAHWIEKGLQALEGEATKWSGTCLMGDAPSIADVCLVPQLAAARRFGVDTQRLEILSRIDSHLSALAPFVVAHADKQPDAPAH